MDRLTDLERLTQLMRDKVEEADRGELGRIELAALVWAACSRLWNQGGVSQISEEWSPPPLRGLEEASRALRGLGRRPSATELYRTLASVLVAIEDEIDAAAAPSVTLVSLPRWQAEDPPLLSGEVQVWFREPSLLRTVRSGRDKPAAAAAIIDAGADASAPKTADPPDSPELNRAMRYRLEPDRHLRSLTFLLASFERPRAKLLPKDSDRNSALWDPLLHASAIHGESSLRIALCPLRGPWFPQFEIVEDQGESKFIACPLIFEKAPGSFDAHLDLILQEAAARSVRILVFPEMSIDAALRTRLRKKLRSLKNNRLLAVLGGTYHIGPESGLYRNEAVVWDGRGEPLWEQNKQGIFRLKPEDVRKSRRFFPNLKSDPRTSVVEGIERGGELVVVDTNLGRLAILICADALEPGSYKEILRRVQPDLVFILAMSPKTLEFDKERDWLVRQDIATLFVNAACVCQKRLKDELVFFDLSLQEDGSGPPTRWRWPIGRQPEWYRYRLPEEADPGIPSQSDRRKEGGDSAEEEAAVTAEEPWSPLSELAPGASPVELLPSETGLVLDLGAYLRRS